MPTGSFCRGEIWGPEGLNDLPRTTQHFTGRFKPRSCHVTPVQGMHHHLSDPLGIGYWFSRIWGSSRRTSPTPRHLPSSCHNPRPHLFSLSEEVRNKGETRIGKGRRQDGIQHTCAEQLWRQSLLLALGNKKLPGGPFPTPLHPYLHPAASVEW